MISEVPTLVSKEIAKEVIDATIEAAKQEVINLPDKIGEMSDVELLPDKIDAMPKEVLSERKLMASDTSVNLREDKENVPVEIPSSLQKARERSVDKVNKIPGRADALGIDQLSIATGDASSSTRGYSEFNDLQGMKECLGKNYSEIKENKPPNSPDIAKWFENGGTVRIEQIDSKSVWTYIDAKGRSVQYIDGKVKFPSEAKHPIIEDISIGKFTGDRNTDKKLYLEKLEEEYGLTDIPDGYVLHHDTENGILQLIKEDYHKEFTHAGGYSMYKEGE